MQRVCYAFASAPGKSGAEFFPFYVVRPESGISFLMMGAQSHFLQFRCSSDKKQKG